MGTLCGVLAPRGWAFDPMSARSSAFDRQFQRPNDTREAVTTESNLLCSQGGDFFPEGSRVSTGEAASEREGERRLRHAPAKQTEETKIAKCVATFRVDKERAMGGRNQDKVPARREVGTLNGGLALFIWRHVVLRSITDVVRQGDERPKPKGSG